VAANLSSASSKAVDGKMTRVTKPKLSKAERRRIVKAAEGLTQEQQELVRLARRAEGIKARETQEKGKNWKQVLAKMSAQGRHGKKGGRPVNERIREIMEKHQCSRQWAYELLKREEREA